MARRKRSGNKNFPKRSSLWLPFSEQIALTTANSPVKSSTLLDEYFNQTGAELPVGATLGPIRGIVVITPNVSTVFNSNQSFMAVLQLVPEGGRTQTPNPTGDIMDAMWYGQFAATTPAGESAAGVFIQMPTVVPFETRAMRKITGNGQDLIVTAESFNNADYNLQFLGNVFIKLP